MSCDNFKFLNLVQTENFTHNDVERFLVNGCDINFRDDLWDTVFFRIIINPNISLEYCKHLLKYSPYLGNGVVIDYFIHYSQYDLTDKALFLIENTTDFSDKSYTRAFYGACSERSFIVADVLLNKGVNVNFDVDDNITISYMSTFLHDLLNHGGNFNMLRNIIKKLDIELLNMEYNNFTILYIYSRLNRTEEIKILLERGVNVNDEKFLIQICHFGNTEILNRVVNEIDREILNPPSGSENSPLMEASYEYHTDIVDILIDHGCDVNFTDDSDISILVALVSSDTIGPKIDVVTRLLDAGVNINYTDIFNRTALFYTNDKDILIKLILYGGDINHIDRHKQTILMNAVRMLRHDLVRAILGFGPSTYGILEVLEKLRPYHFNIIHYIDDPPYVNDVSLTREEIDCLHQYSEYLIRRDLLRYGI